MRLTTIVKPPSIMRVELMKRRGIMPKWRMATLAMHGIMQRKLVNITLRNTARKNRLTNGDETIKAPGQDRKIKALALRLAHPAPRLPRVGAFPQVKARSPR